MSLVCAGPELDLNLEMLPRYPVKQATSVLALRNYTRLGHVVYHPPMRTFTVISKISQWFHISLPSNLTMYSIDDLRCAFFSMTYLNCLPRLIHPSADVMVSDNKRKLPSVNSSSYGQRRHGRALAKCLTQRIVASHGL